MAKQLNKSISGGSNLHFGIQFDVNKNTLNEVKTSLTEIQRLTSSDLMDLNKGMDLNEANIQLREIKQTAFSIKQALSNSFNSDLGSLNVSKFNTELAKTGLNLNQIQATFATAGAKGQTAFRGLATELLTTNRQVKQTHKIIQDMANTMANTVKWGIASSVMNNFTGSVQKAYSFVKELDTSLNNIRIVTGKSADEMAQFAVQANKAAKNLASTTTTYTDAALIYYQQGLGDEETQARAETTVKTANVTGQSGRDVSEELTAVWNGYKVNTEETELYVDKLAKVAAGTAADLEELSTGMSKVASAANVAGVDVDQLNATLATVISVTREAPETIGTAFKTIYARLGDLALDGQDEYGVTLGNVSGKMEELGIQILDESGNMRDMGDIIEDTAEKWETWTQAQKQAAAVAMAGKMQYSRLITLFENWGMYEDALNMSKDALGELNNENEIYMDSAEAHLAKLRASMEGLYNSLFDADSINIVADSLTFIVNRVTDLVDGLGGGAGVLLNFGAIATRVFDKQISSSLATTITNIKNMNKNLATATAEAQLLEEFKGIKMPKFGSESYEEILTMKREIIDFRDSLTIEEEQEANAALKRYNNLLTEKDILEENQREASEYLSILSQITNDKGETPYEDIKNTSTFSQTKDGESKIDFKNDLDDEDKFGDLVDDIEVYNKALDAQEQEYKNVQKAAAKYRQTMDALDKIHDEYAETTEEETEAEKSLRKALSLVRDEMEGLKTDSRLGADEIEKLKIATEQYDEAVNNQNIDPTVATNVARNLVNAYENAYSSIDTRTQQTKKTIEDAANGMGRAISENAKIAKDNWNENTSKMRLEAQIKNVVDLVGSIGQLTGALSSVVSLYEIWNNEDLTAGEKLIKTIETVSFLIPTVISGFQGLLTTGPKVLISLAGHMGALAAAEGTTATMADIMWTSLLWPIGLVVAGIALVTAGIYGLVKAWNADSDAAKKAREEAIQTKEQYQDMKDVYADLVENITDYGDAINALKKLEEGTLEWKQAVLELNEQVLTLIDKYPELASAITSSENGILSITPDAINRLLEQQFNEIQASFRSSNSASIKASRAELKSEKTDFRRNITYEQEQPNQFNTTQTSSFEQTSPNTYSESVYVGMTEDEMDKLQNALENNGLSILENNETLKKATGFNDNLTKELMKNKDEIVKFNSTLIETNATIKSLKLANAQSYLATHSTAYNNLAMEDQGKAAMGFTAETEDFDDQGKYDSGTFGWSWLRIGAKHKAYSDKEIHEQYAELMGYDYVKDKSGKGLFKDRNDEEVEVSDSVMREALKQEAAMKHANEQSQKYINALNNMTNAGNEAANSFNLIGTEAKNTSTLLKSGFQGQFDFSTATDNQLLALKSIRDDKEQWSKISSGYAEAGYKSAKEFNKAFDEEMKQWNTPEKSAERARNLEEVTNQKFAAAIKEDAKALETTESALLSYTEHLMQTNKALKEDKLLAEQVAVASFEFADGVEALGEALDSNEQLLKDWMNGLTDSTEAYEAIGEVQEALEKMFGIRVSDKFIKENFENLKKLANGDVTALEELQEAAAKDYVANLTIKADDTRAEQVKNELNSWIDEINSRNIQVGASIDDTDFITALNNMIQSGEMTSDQVQSYLNSIGYEPEWDEETASTEPQVMHATTDVSANLFGKDVKVATLSTDTTVDGVTATMFGISNAKDGSGNKKLKSAKKVSSTSNRASSVKNSGKSGQKVGSGGGSKKDPEKMDPIEEERDRYHDVNIELKQIETQLGRLQKQKDKLFGAALIDNLNKQLKQLDKQIDTTNQKISIARGELSELRGKLSGQGVSFNADGTIGNYAAAYQSQLNYVNGIINRYNSMSAEAQEKYKDTVENAKENFDKFVENISRYDELVSDEIPGLEDEIQDAINEKIEIQIEEFDMEIEIRLNLAEAERDWNEFKKKVIDGIKDDDILGNTSARLADFSSYYKDNENGIVQAGSRHLEDTLEQLKQMDRRGWSDVYGDNRTAALEDLKKYYEQLMEDLTNIEELQEEIHESYMDMMDEAQEKFDEQIEAFEMVTSLIEHDMNVISLVNGEEAYGPLAEYYEKQEQNNLKQLDFQRQQVDFWRAQMDAAEEGSDRWEAAKEKWMDAVDAWNSAVEESIENLQDKYLNAINLIFQNLNNKVTGGMGLDYVGEEWDLINQNADQYLDTINSLYETQALEDKYLDALDKTDSIAAQRQLKELMDEELADLRERDKLTQYDIDRANMKYEIALKQIALQEAQQNKTSMRLRRDSQGNYTYQYTADDSEVANAQQELNDLYNSLYNFDKENYTENLNQLYDIWAEFQEKMAEAAQINDPTARAERELLLQEQYGELINGIVEQNEQIRTNLYDSAFLDLANLYEVDVSNFQTMTDEEKEILMGDLLPYWTSGVQQMADVFAGEDGFLGVCRDAFDEITEATKDYEDSLDSLQDAANTDFEEIRDGIDETIDQTIDLIDDNDELINKYEEQLDAIGRVIGQLDTLIAKYSAAKNEAIAATEAAYKYWQFEQQRAAEAAARNSGGGSGGSNSGNGAGGSGSGRSGGRAGSGDGNLAVGDVATYTGRYYSDSWGGGNSGSRYAGVARGIVVDKVNGNPYGIHIHSADGRYRDLGWIKRSQLSGYDTGGYTGSWGDDSGKLALLHQKELVLNENDTSNILNAVKILRDVTDIIGSSVLSKIAAISANSTMNGSGFGDTLEQNVHIDASFPNVTDSHEIQDAIDNLLNVATQRINRR